MLKRITTGMTTSEHELEEVRKTLQESEAKYRLLFENSMDPVFLMENGKFIDCNKAALEILRCPHKDQILGLRPSQISPEKQPDDRLSEEKEKKAIYFTYNERKDQFEWVHRTFDGTDFWVQVSLTVVPVNGKQITHVHWRDITKQKHMEAVIRESEELYRSLFNNSMDAILLTVPDGRILAANPEACKIFGRTEEDLLRTGREGVVDRTDLRLAGALQERKRTGRFRGELTFLRKNGTPFPGEISSVIFKDRDGNEMTSMVIRDITERKLAEDNLRMLLSELENKNKELRKAYEELKRSEAMLIQSEKMASLGHLSAGIAHELKNPLSIILQGIAYVQSSVEDGTLIDACDRIKKSAIRADTVIHNLLSFSRQAPPSFSEEDMNIVIEESLAMVEHQLNLQNIEVIRDYSRRIPKVSVDGNQIKEVFINIFINAADAMKDGGTITLTTTAGTGKNGQPCVEVAITDTGTGIPEEILENVFDPFFTTKRDSGGTGLGLSVTKGIIDRHHGSIVINSKVGAGTTVTITLPCNPPEKGDALNG